MSKPTLYLICGLPGAGKTTLARQIERDRRALRLTPDEWIVQLFGTAMTQAELDSHRDPVERLQWEVASRALSAGVNVILDWGFWSRREREDFRSRAAAVGAQTEVHVLDVPRPVLSQRLAARNANVQPGTFHVSEAQLDEWEKWWEPAIEQ
jgi:predicted kinase